MGKILAVGTYATDDPTRATMPFVAMFGAIERGHEPGLVLMGEAVYLMNDQIVDDIQGVGFPPLRELFDMAIDNDVPFYI